MPRHLCDGIEQANPTSDLELLTTRDVLLELSDNTGASFFKVQDSLSSTVFEVNSDGNARIVGNLTVEGTTFTADSNTVNIGDNYLLLNADNVNSVTNQDSGLLNKRIVSLAINCSSIVAATRTINTNSTPVGTIAADDIVAISGTDNNDGLYEVQSVTASTIVIKPSSILQGIAGGGSLVDETISFTAHRANPSFLGFKESDDSFEFGILGDAGASDTYVMIGLGDGGATAFSAGDPDISLSGTSAANSFASNAGINSGGLANSSATNIQDVIADLDAAIAGAGASFATPALSFGTANAAGAASTVIRSDATLAIFDATNPETIEAGDSAAVGTANFAARRDHVHAIAVAAPSSVGTANAEGSAASFSRSDHVHAHGDLSAAAASLIFHEGRNIEVNASNFSPANYVAAAGGDGEASFVSVEDHLRGIDTVLATIPAAPPGFATPALSFGTANAAGAAGTVIRSDATLAIFDATVPSQVQAGVSASAGSVAFAARRDHVHNIETGSPVGLAISADEGVSSALARADHTHPLEPDGDAQKFGKEDIASGATSVSVTYDNAFAFTPFLQVQVVNIGGAADPHITAIVTASSNTGFTVTLSGPTPDSGYDIHWHALLQAGGVS